MDLKSRKLDINFISHFQAFAVDTQREPISYAHYVYFHDRFEPGKIYIEIPQSFPINLIHVFSSPIPSMADYLVDLPRDQPFKLTVL